MGNLSINQSRNKQTLDAYAQCLTSSNLPSLTIRNDAVKISAGENQIITLNCGAILSAVASECLLVWKSYPASLPLLAGHSR
jgi:hypothetical protein